MCGFFLNVQDPVECCHVKITLYNKQSVELDITLQIFLSFSY